MCAWLPLLSKRRQVIGVFFRPDSPWWWLYLENAPSGHRREKTAIRIGAPGRLKDQSRRMAEQVYAQRVTELAANIHRLPLQRPVVRFAAYAALYERDIVPQHRGASREREILVTLRKAFKDDLLHLIDRDRVRAWMQTRGRKVSARTVNRELDVLRSVLKSAIPKYLETHPLAGLKRLHVVQPRRRLLSRDEETRLLEQLAPDDKAIFLVGLDTLTRLTDILDLKRADDHGHALYIADPKSGRPHIVPVSKRLRIALDGVPKGDGPYYFPRRRRASTEAGRRMVVRSALKDACARCTPPIPYGRANDGITFHWSTRRTGATRLIVEAKIDPKTVQTLGGWHTTAMVLDIYTEARSEAMAAVVEQIGACPVPSRSKRKRA